MAIDLPIYRPIESQPTFAGILRNQELFATADDDKVSNRINTEFDRIMIQSSVDISPTTLLMLCMLSGIVVGGLILVIQENPLSASVGLVMGSVLPLLYVLFARMRRQQLMTQQLPGMIEELARAAKTGRSIDQCCAMIAEDTPEPFGSELRTCARRMQMGEDVASSMRDLPERTGIVALNILVTSLAVHQQTGGDLVMVLERLAQTIRDRLLFLGRLRAATIGSRWTAVLMLTLPPIIITFFMFRDANYLNQLLSTYWGRFLTIFAAILDLIGSVWVLSILKGSQRT
ncbi:MAG: type II secretion system F family protein [Planctomycetaceae bacterium]|nr:type II secretion system F family protein [Planctomycetaceae bacterium]